MGINPGYTGQAVLMGLFYNAALLLALSAIYEVTSAIPSKIQRAQPIINGLLIALISIAIMSFPFRLQTGVIFDTRSILLSVTALIFGPVPIMIAAFAASLYRLMVGGAGSLPGIAVIMVSALIGLAWRRWLYPKSAKWRWLSIYIMSICVHEVMLVCMLLLLYPDSLNVIREIAIPVMVIYPIASVLLSLLLIRQQDNRRMHGQLKQAEEKYRKITENMSDVIWTADINLRMTYVSPSIETLVGEPVQAYLNRTPEEKFSPESLKKIQALLTEEMGNEKDPLCDKYRTRIVELEHYHADGTLLWLSANISILRDDKGNAIGFQGVSRNITDRKRSEQSEREALLRLRSLIDSSPT